MARSLRLPLRYPMLISTRMEGRNRRVREVSAVLDFNAPYCVVLAPDAIDLGYPEAANKHTDEMRIHPERVPYFTTMRGIDRGIVVTLRRVSIGPLSVSEVDAVVLELQHPRFITFDMILGRTFLKDFKMSVRMKGEGGYLSLVPSQ